MTKFYCDYCDTFLTHDSPSVRKTHNTGRKHKDMVRNYYQKWMDQRAQQLVDATAAAFAQRGRVMSGPPGGMMPPMMGRGMMMGGMGPPMGAHPMGRGMPPFGGPPMGAMPPHYMMGRLPMGHPMGPPGGFRPPMPGAIPAPK
ncbi:hypothetical protein PENTCL1PPCAC_29699 [Pristionchus entomophagus]|uniref:U1 small nuclear ribonucleoprotein C n=1 Tax=Pristionchus entomophagus TaxID=358040 RepID=A0AAV5UMU0_9BILA|nr:hypothetical protein PENTCL1PPCAC_29699 [Pristionchus entomophagus]